LNEDEKRLFYTLSNVALISPCYRSEIIETIHKDFDEFEKGTDKPKAHKPLIDSYESIFEEGKVYYLISKNLHLWICENFSELLQSTMLLDIDPQDTPPNDADQFNV